MPRLMVAAAWAQAVFDDNSVLTVEPTGAAFTAKLPNGDSVQQLSCCATRRRGVVSPNLLIALVLWRKV